MYQHQYQHTHTQMQMEPTLHSPRLSRMSWSELAASNPFRSRVDQRPSQFLSGDQNLDQDNFWEFPELDQAKFTVNALATRGPRPKGNRRVCSLKISQLFILLISCLLLPSALLLAFIICNKVTPSRGIFADPQQGIEQNVIYVNYSATSMANISSVSATLAPFLIGIVMALWSPYVARSLVKASQGDFGTPQELPEPQQFSFLVGMRAGLPDQLWRYITHSFKAFRRQKHERTPLILRQTALILLLCLSMAGLTFVGDQVFHIWTTSVVLNKFEDPSVLNRFSRGLTSSCQNYSISDNFGFPCTRPSSTTGDVTVRANEIEAIRANTSELNQVRFLTDSSLQNGDLAVLFPSPGLVPSNIGYRGTTLGVSTQCQLITPTCELKYLSKVLTQVNCTNDFFGVLGKPPNITSSPMYKAQDPDVPGLAWKISQSLEYAFFSDKNLSIPYNTQGWDPATGNPDTDPNSNLQYYTNAQLVNPVHLGVMSRIHYTDLAATGSSLASTPSLFRPTDDGTMFDFIMHCAYTTYEVEYTLINGTAQPGFTFTPTPNGSVAEEWHGYQSYVSLDGDPSNGLIASNWIAAKQLTPAAFARTWANLYSTRVLAVIGAYTDPRVNLAEQVRSELLVSRIVPWTLGLLLAANFAYLVLGVVVGGVAWAVTTKEVLEINRELDLGRQVSERYGTGEGDHKSMAEQQDGEEAVGRGGSGGLRVGVVQNRFEPLYFAR